MDVTLFMVVYAAVGVGHDDQRLKGRQRGGLVGDGIAHAGVVQHALEEEIPVADVHFELFGDFEEELPFAVGDLAVAAHQLDEVFDPVDAVPLVCFHGSALQ